MSGAIGRLKGMMKLWEDQLSHTMLMTLFVQLLRVSNSDTNFDEAHFLYWATCIRSKFLNIETFMNKWLSEIIAKNRIMKVISIVSQAKLRAAQFVI